MAHVHCVALSILSTSLRTVSLNPLSSKSPCNCWPEEDLTDVKPWPLLSESCESKMPW